VAEINGLILHEEALKQCEFPFTVNIAEPIIALQAPQTNGLRCTFGVKSGFVCPYVCGSIRNIRKHAFETHGWKTPSGRGRRKKDATIPDVPWRSGVSYQRFFVQGPKSGFFEVGRGTGERLSGEAEET
jgi:hypothetical protein